MAIKVKIGSAVDDGVTDAELAKARHQGSPRYSKDP